MGRRGRIPLSKAAPPGPAVTRRRASASKTCQLIDGNNSRCALSVAAHSSTPSASISGSPAMNVSLGAKWERFIEQQLKTGDHQSASEVVRDGLRLIERRDLLARRGAVSSFEDLQEALLIAVRSAFSSSTARCRTASRSSGFSTACAISTGSLARRTRTPLPADIARRFPTRNPQRLVEVEGGGRIDRLARVAPGAMASGNPGGIGLGHPGGYPRCR